MASLKSRRAVTAKLFEARYVRPAQGATLVVGSRIYPGREDRRRRYPQDVIGIDMQAGEGVDLVMDLEESVPNRQFNHVDCISVLEHSRRPWLMAANIERLLVAGGTLFVQAPFVWWVHGYPYDYWRFTAAGIRQLFQGIDWQQFEYVHSGTTPEGVKLPKVSLGDWPHFPRTELCGFGVRR